MPGFLNRDATLSRTVALPNGANTTTSGSIDLDITTRSDFVADAELRISSPALNGTELPNGETITYQVFHDTQSNFATETLLANVGTVTGSGGTGAAAQEFRVRPPTNAKRYVRLKCVKTGTGNASAKSATIDLLT